MSIQDYRQHPALQNIRVVLIETSHPGNIGAVARAMKNMGLSKLVLVKPKHFPSVEASTRASSAADLLAHAQVVEDLASAIKGVKHVFGASARLRKVRWPQMSVRQTGQMAVQRAIQGDEVALVFGRESSGLTNAEMDKCHFLSHIPTNPEYSSLNLAQAVQVFAYECLMATDLVAEPPLSQTEMIPSQRKLASTEQLEGFYQHLYQALQDIEFLDPAKNARFMRRMRRLFNRAQLDVKEIDILRGILTAAQRKVEKAKDV